MRNNKFSGKKIKEVFSGNGKKIYKKGMEKIRAVAFCLIFAMIWNAIPVTANVSDNLQSAVMRVIGQKNDTTTAEGYRNATIAAKLNYLKNEISNLSTMMEVDDTNFSSAASWADIQTIVRSGRAKSQFSIGETRIIDLSSMEAGDAQVTLVDIAPDGKRITCMITAYTGTEPKHVMNQSAKNKGSWCSSFMRGWLNGSVYYGKLPSDLRAVIADSSIVTCDYNTGANITTVNKLFLPATNEVFGTQGNSMAYETSATKQFQYFAFIATSNTSRALASSGCWWLRSPSNSNGTNFCCVNRNGYSHDNADNSYSVFPAFCIK